MTSLTHVSSIGNETLSDLPTCVWCGAPAEPNRSIRVTRGWIHRACQTHFDEEQRSIGVIAVVLWCLLAWTFLFAICCMVWL
jgi:hypothetical protein